MRPLPFVAVRVAAATAFAACLLAGARDASADYPLLCNLAFVEETDAAFRHMARLEFRMLYPAAQLDFGAGTAPCEVHPLQAGVTGTFTLEQEGEMNALRVELERDNGLFPYPLASCTPRGAIDWELAQLTVELVEARDKDGDTLEPPPEVAVDSFECVDVTSTTTTTTIPTSTTVPDTTTTTLPPDGMCGDADDNGSIAASDALLVLRAAVGSATCPAARCDTDSNSFVNASDALRILRAAVGLAEPLDCP
jgi:hypothetical protein